VKSNQPSVARTLLAAIRILAPCAVLAGAATPARAQSAPADTSSASASPAKDAVTCESAFERAQHERNAGRYVAALSSAVNCTNPVCGDALFNECGRVYAELQSAIPTVVLGARDATGDLYDVQVSVDGQVLLERLDGRPVPLDPGPHKFTFHAAGHAPVERDATVRAGEKYRQIAAIFGPAEPQLAPPGMAVGAQSAPTPSRQIPVASYVLGGVGLIGIGGFVAFRVIGARDYDTLQQGCAPTCPSSDIDQVKQKYTLSYVSLGVGAAALASAVVVYFAQGDSATKTGLSVSPTRDGMTAHVVTHF